MNGIQAQAPWPQAVRQTRKGGMGFSSSLPSSGGVSRGARKVGEQEIVTFGRHASPFSSRSAAVRDLAGRGASPPSIAKATVEDGERGGRVVGNGDNRRRLRAALS